MHHLGAVLSSVLAEENLSQRELADRCGITPTTMHAILRGRPCSPDTLKALCRSASGNLRWRYEVLLAHLRDEAERSGLDTSFLVIQYRDGVPLSDLGLDETLNVTFAILARQAKEDPALKRLLDSLVEIGIKRESVAVDQAGAGQAVAEDLKRYST